MKCKNCNCNNHNSCTQCTCLEKTCKHLEDSHGDDWAIEITQGNENGLGLTFSDRHTIWPVLNNIRFCPFCGEKLI